MTNEEKYKTVEERIKAFRNHCNPIVGHCGTRCRMSEPDKSGGYDMMKCFAYWLTLEAEEETPMPCPFCGGETHSNLGHLKAGVVHYWVDCISPDCMYRSAHYTDKEAEAIAAHNRVCRAVAAYNEGEVKE